MAAFPPQVSQNGSDPALIGRSNPIYIYFEGMYGDASDRGFLIDTFQPLRDWPFPYVLFVSGSLFWGDVLLFKRLIGPPFFAVLMEMHSFSE